MAAACLSLPRGSWTVDNIGSTYMCQYPNSIHLRSPMVVEAFPEINAKKFTYCKEAVSIAPFPNKRLGFHANLLSSAKRFSGI